MKKDRLVGIGAILTAMFFFYHTWSVKVPTNLAEPGPRLLPFIAEALMVICGIGVIVESELKRTEGKVYLKKDGWKRLGWAFLLLVVYALALTYLGFVLTTPFMAFILINMLSGEKKLSPMVKIVGSLCITAGFYLMFTKGFGVMLPQAKF